MLLGSGGFAQLYPASTIFHFVCFQHFLLFFSYFIGIFSQCIKPKNSSLAQKKPMRFSEMKAIGMIPQQPRLAIT